MVNITRMFDCMKARDKEQRLVTHAGGCVLTVLFSPDDYNRWRGADGPTQGRLQG